MEMSPEILAAYRERDRELSIRKSRIGCLWGVVSIPAFSLDTPGLLRTLN